MVNIVVDGGRVDMAAVLTRGLSKHLQSSARRVVMGMILY